jgi:hypothetical protein
MLPLIARSVRTSRRPFSLHHFNEAALCDELLQPVLQYICAGFWAMKYAVHPAQTFARQFSWKSWYTACWKSLAAV